MSSIRDSIIQASENDPILRNKLFDVPMRLFRNNYSFKHVILDIISHMKATLNSKYDDYPEVKGISGANVGIPYNIIIIKAGEENKVFLNPLMGIRDKEEVVEVESNCGSIVLKEPIKIKRYKKIFLSWYDEELGHHHTEEFEGRLAYTIQHEVEHNQGVLITDKK